MRSKQPFQYKKSGAAGFSPRLRLFCMLAEKLYQSLANADKIAAG